MGNKKVKRLECSLFFVFLLTACNMGSVRISRSVTPIPSELPSALTSSQTLESGQVLLSDTPLQFTTTPVFSEPTLTSTNESTLQSPIQSNTPQPSTGCRIGTGLREQTVEIILANKAISGLVMSASSELADLYFPHLESWIRILGAPSLEGLQNKADKASLNQVPYEALGYGLETSKSTPEEEWRNLVASTLLAKDLADEYDKLLVMGPGFQLMSRNEDQYAPMASAADIWILQTQQLQKDPPSSSYREEVERIVQLIRSGNSNIAIWAQITLPPDREPNVAEWLAYRLLIEDLVDGTYVGVYTWDGVDDQKFIDTINAIFESVCGINS